MSAVSALPRRLLRDFLRKRGYRVERVSDEEWRFLENIADERGPLPADAGERLRADHPRLREIERRYAALDLPVTRHSRWRAESIGVGIVLHYFRGESLFLWSWRERRLTTQLKYFVYLADLEARDRRGLLRTLGEDGAFGCWTFDFPGRRTVSRDLLDSANELGFLDRHYGLFERAATRVLDIGAGYGRLAHRFVEAGVKLADYCCVDAVPASSFLSEYYLGFRKVSPPARVALLDEVHALQPGSFDLVMNVHSFSECTHAAIEWWLQQLERLRVPTFFLVPNDGDKLLSTEADGSRRDFSDLVAGAGYRLKAAAPVIADPAARELFGNHDQMLLFQR